MKKQTNEALLTQTNLYSEAKRRYNELNKIKVQKEKALAKSPKGKLHIVNKKGIANYYVRTDPSDRSGTYLPKTNSEEVRNYAQKSYDEKILKLVDAELSNLDSFLKKTNRQSNTYITQIQQVYSDSHPEIKALISPIDMSDYDYISKWLSEDYIRKEISDTVPFYETDLKERVRSKSELTIANALFKYGIPYKYEYPLTLQNGQTIYPDFTILNVRTRQIYYWEHRGMMDDPEYATHTVFRMKNYLNEGIILGKNLIITEETSINPLGTNEINAIIENLLCSL